ncbi:MAG: HPr family phosphocarrier protein [Eubacteriales bacterium]|nr:HPr family phosphocarrier protein [Eubacteriales bacterium]
MYAFEHTVNDPVGIHARPAGQLAKEATKFQSKVMLCKGDKRAELRRMMAVMGLGVKQGDTIRIEVEGADEDAAGAAIRAFVEANL